MTERDKFLTEAMGECWHDFVMTKNPDSRDAEGWTCTKCHIYTTYIHSLYCDFSTWGGFGKLFLWAKEQEWWDILFWQRDSKEILHTADIENLIHPDRFADAVYEFLKEGQ